MAIAFRGISDQVTYSGTNYPGSSYNLVPPGTVAGDLMIMFCFTTQASGTANLIAPAGWTQFYIDPDTSTFHNGRSVYWKIATASEPAKPAFNASGTWIFTCISYSGTASSNPLSAAVLNTTSSNSTTLTFPSVTPSDTTSVMVGFSSPWANDYGFPNISTEVSGSTRRREAGWYGTGNTSTAFQYYFWDMAVPSTSATGTKTATIATAKNSVSLSFLIGAGSTSLSINTNISNQNFSTTGGAIVWSGSAAAASGGTAPYTYSISAGSLPTGLSISSTTGAITGTPTVAGTYAGIKIRVTDSAGTPATADTNAFTITVTTPATKITLTGPTSGNTSVASTNFTLTSDNYLASNVTVTLSDGGAGGNFTPSAPVLAAGTGTTATFTYTPNSTAGNKTITFTNNGGLSNVGTNWTYTANVAAATAVTMTGPSSGPTGIASTNFTVQTNGNTVSNVVVTPSDGAGGTFTPASVTLTAGNASSGTFTYTPSSAGAKTITYTNDGGLTNTNSSFSYTSQALSTAVTLTGPTSGNVGSPSTNFTVQTNGYSTANVTVTPSDSSAGGSFTPTSVTITAGYQQSATFTYTPASSGAKTITVTNSAGLTSSGSVTYTVAAPAATKITLSGPTGCIVGSASSSFTVQTNGTTGSNITVTPSDGGGGGTFSPTTVTIPAGSNTFATFGYTASSAGSKTISITNNGGLTNFNTLSVTATTVAGTITTPPLKNNTGSVLANISGWTMTVWTTSGAFVASIPGLVTDSSGVLVGTVAGVTPATNYLYDVSHSTYGRRLPNATAT